MKESGLKESSKKRTKLDPGSYSFHTLVFKMKYPYQNLTLKDLKGERWEDIPELDGYYRISNFGRIKENGVQHAV